jgi:hypothetical protein
MACVGPERRFVDFLSFDRRILDPNLCYFLKRTGRDELEWDIPILIGGKAEYRKLTGESVIDYFTEQAVAFNAEIEAFLAEHNAKTIAPFPVDLREEETPEADYDPAKPFAEQDFGFLDNTLADVP